MKNTKEVLRPSYGAYLTLVVIFSAPLVIIPVVMGFELYVSSEYWIIHVPLFVVTIIWFIFLYQEVIITDEWIQCRVIRWSGIREKKVKYSQVLIWGNENPIKLKKRDGDIFEIRWTMYTQKDKNLLFKTLTSNFGSPKVNEL